MTSRVSCQKGPTRHAYAWQIGAFWQDTLDILSIQIHITHNWIPDDLVDGESTSVQVMVRVIDLRARMAYLSQDG